MYFSFRSDQFQAMQSQPITNAASSSCQIQQSATEGGQIHTQCQLLSFNPLKSYIFGFAFKPRDLLSKIIFPADATLPLRLFNHHLLRSYPL